MAKVEAQSGHLCGDGGAGVVDDEGQEPMLGAAEAMEAYAPICRPGRERTRVEA